MTFYLYNKNNEVYCEPLHPIHMPEMAACGFDTEERAKKYAEKVGMKPKDRRIRNLKSGQEMLTCRAVNDLKIQSTHEYMFCPVGETMVLEALDKDGNGSGCVLTAHGAKLNRVV